MNFVIGEFNKYYEMITNEKNLKIEFEIQSNPKTSSFDDVFGANISSSKGVIYGNSKRALLLSVYEVLKQNGATFIKPGIENEVINKKKANEFNAKFHIEATKRHRAICIEGAVSLENCLDIIDWAPKAGFNGYFIQFRTAHEFFERWYQHQRNPLLEKERYSIEDSKRIVEKMIFEIKKRDMIYHAVGHGWTNEVLGIPSTGWQEVSLENYQDINRNHLALIDGKREFFNNKPLNTQLCYGNSDVVNLLANEVLNYALKHPKVDIIHFWLADDYNNFCECELCKNHYPADLYVHILNMIDQKLTDHHLDVKIAFLIYHELSWAPKVARIKNEDRFILMYAPISRTYLTGYQDAVIPEETIDFKLNQIVLPKDIGENLVFLKSWQKIFKGDSFLFDYHLMWDVFKDYSHYKLAKVLYEDIKQLEALNLNGYISCQIQRNAFPTNLGMYVLSQALTTNDAYEEIVKDFFEKSYGLYASGVMKIIQEHSKIYDFAYARRESKVINIAYHERLIAYLPQLKKDAQTFKEIIKTNDINEHLIAQNLLVFSKYLEYMIYITDILILRTEGYNKDKLYEKFELAAKSIFKFEEVIQKEFDGFFFHLIVGDFIKEIN